MRSNNRVYCRNCKKKRELLVMGMYCSETCKGEFFEKTIRKVAERTKRKIEEQSRMLKEFKESISTKKKANELRKRLRYNYAKHIGNVKRNLQKWAKIRDEQNDIYNCVSCKEPFKKNKEDRQGGHFFKAQTYTNVSIHPNNIWSQCQHCNSFADGNGAGYSIGIRERVSKDELDYLENTADRGSYKFDKDFLNLYTDEILKQINTGKINAKILINLIEDYLLKFDGKGNLLK
jgi:5-methylcytosine-specific restriction endonuclease McrA